MRVSLSPEDFKEILLSHHPDLPCFRDDVVIVCNRRICAGCLFAYPTALAVLILLGPFGYESVIIAVLLALVSMFRRFSKNRIVQNFFRMVAGIALGFGLGGGYWAIVNGQWSMLLLLVSGAGVYSLVKLHSIKRKLECSTNPAGGCKS